MLRRLSLLTLLIAWIAPAAPASSLEKEIAQVERIRGLRFLRPVVVTTIGRGEVAGHLRSQLVRTMPYSLGEYMERLAALHLIDRDSVESEKQLFKLLDQQVLAFYDPLAHTYYDIQDAPEGMAGMVPSSMVTVHELTHALQDQRFALSVRDRALASDWDASLAYHSVVEGEATLVMMASMLEGVTTLEGIVGSEVFLEKMGEAAQSGAMIDSSAPRYFVESLKFPYFAGLRLVIEAYRRGGWKAVDALHADPPRSTREVIHPEEYFRRVAIAGRGQGFPAPPAAGEERLGEFHWAYLVGAGNARGWRADSVSILRNARCETTVLARIEWDSEAQARTFGDAYEMFLREREPRAAVVSKGNVVRAAYGADAAAIKRFLQ